MDILSAELQARLGHFLRYRNSWHITRRSVAHIFDVSIFFFRSQGLWQP